MKIPNIKKILKPRWAHKPGYWVNPTGWHKHKVWQQGTVPKDPKILQKLGIKKGEKVLAIAGYYGDWAGALQKHGAKVDFSDISRSMVNYVKKQKDRKFEKYICSEYELVPKKTLEYDWTFTYEACGGGQGLPLSYLRSLLNRKGGILVFYLNKEKPKSMGGKIDRYSKIVKNISKAYDCKCSGVRKRIKAFKGKKKLIPRVYVIHKILTNNSARKKAELDIKVLWKIKNKKLIDKKYRDSIKRLGIVSKSMGDGFIREVELK